MAGNKLDKQLQDLQKNLNILRERKAKFGDNAPLELLNLIEDHEQAIGFVEQARASEISEEELAEQLAPLNLAHPGTIQNIFHLIPRPFLVGALLVGVTIAGALFLNTSWGKLFLGPAPTATPTPTPFAAPAEPGQLLILVAEFESSGQKVVAAHEDILDKLQEEVRRLNLTNVLVKSAPPLSNQQQIEDWTQTYRPTFIIWGGTDDVRTVTRFTITAAEGEALAYVPPTKTLLDLKDFNLIISYDLPEQMAFFSKFTIGQILFRDNNLLEAGKVFGSALQNSPPDIPVETIANAYFYQGFTQQNLGKLEQALTYYQQALDRNATIHQAYYNRGVAHTDLGLFDEAVADFTTAIELKPNLALAFLNRANLYRRKEMLDEALQDYNRGLELNPADADARLARGAVYVDRGEHELAMADYNQALQQKPDLLMGYILRADLHKATGHIDEARADYQQALLLIDSRQNSSLYTYVQGAQAWLAYQQGDFQVAIAANRAALEINQELGPEHPEFLNLLQIRFNLALALLADGQTGQAKAEYQTALDLFPPADLLDPVIAEVTVLRDIQPDNTDIVDVLQMLELQQQSR